MVKITLADKIKELREAKNREDANSAFNDDASVMQRACFHRDLSNVLPMLLDCIEIQAEALEKCRHLVPSNLMITENYGHVIVNEAQEKVEAVMK